MNILLSYTKLLASILMMFFGTLLRTDNVSCIEVVVIVYCSRSAGGGVRGWHSREAERDKVTLLGQTNRDKTISQSVSRPISQLTLRLEMQGRFGVAIFH